jgi:hypothetical protein
LSSRFNFQQCARSVVDDRRALRMTVQCCLPHLVALRYDNFMPLYFETNDTQMISLDRRAVVLSLFAATLANKANAQVAEFGRFLDDLSVNLLAEAPKMQLRERFRYEDPSHRVWTTRKGWIVDGASIPRWLWNVIGGPLNGNYRNASVIHDYYCDTRETTWQATHRVFYWAMRAGGVSESQAQMMYAGVLAGGPRWYDDQYVTLRKTTQECNDDVCREREKEVTEKRSFTPTYALSEAQQIKKMLDEVRKSPKPSVSALEELIKPLVAMKFPIELRF